MICYIYHKYIFVCILIMHMFVYCSYNESKNWYLNLKYIIQIWKFIFQFSKLYFNRKNWYFNIYIKKSEFEVFYSHSEFLNLNKYCFSNFESFYLNLKINIWLWKLLFKCKKIYFNSEIISTPKKFIWIWSLKYEFLKMLVVFKNYMFESKIIIPIIKIIFKH
jgi:hypothetical protein